MYTLLLFMLISNHQCLPPAWLYFVLSTAVNYSNIFQSNEVPYVPEFLSLHSELQTYFMISEPARTNKCFITCPVVFNQWVLWLQIKYMKFSLPYLQSPKWASEELKYWDESASTTEKSLSKSSSLVPSGSPPPHHFLVTQSLQNQVLVFREERQCFLELSKNRVRILEV